MGIIFCKRGFHWREDFFGKFMQGKFKSCSLLRRWRLRELVWPGDKPAPDVCLGKLGVGGNYLWCLVTTVVIFMGRYFYRGDGGECWLTPLDTMGLSNYYYAFNTISTRKIQQILCIFSLPQAFVMAMNKLVRLMKVSNLTKN